MDHCSEDLCSKCLELLNNRAIWHDSFSQKKKQNPAFLDERKYREIDESSATCRLCRLVQAALTRYPVDPKPDDIIYYARILFARFSTEHSSSTDTILQSASYGQQAGRADFCYTYRLRVSANYQYKIDLKDNIEDVRDWQSRSCEEHCIYSHPYFEGDIMMLREQADDDRFSNGRRMDACLNFDLAKGWISDCVKHEPIEQHGALLKQKTPNRVIDVRSRSIIRAPQDCLYAALSYCWGPKGTQQVRLNKTTENDLKKPEGLIGFDIPKTILHAILVCEKVGIDYLWVDALCRPQGEEGEYKQESMEDISNIFACAYLTIVGGGADSHHGLPGVGHPRQPQFSERIGDLHLAVSQPHIDEAMQYSAWSGRVWTQDELSRSKRLLFFSDYQVFFTCKCPSESPSFYCEDTYLEESPFFHCEDTYLEASPRDSISIRDLDLPHIHTRWTKLKEFDHYTTRVKDYVGFKSTKPEDRKRAFVGARIMMEPDVGKMHFHDLPVRYFARALCFELDTDVYRRTAYGSPSWSWQGWDIHDSTNFCYDSTKDMTFHISIFYRAEKQPGASQFQFMPLEDYDSKVIVSNNQKLVELLYYIRGLEVLEAFGYQRSEYEKSLPGDSSFPNVYFIEDLDPSPSTYYQDFLPSSEILDTLSAEERSQIIVFFTVTTNFCFSFPSRQEDEGFQQIGRPGREGEELGQGWLNAGAENQTGTFKCIFIGKTVENELFFLVVKEVRENIYSRVGSCLVEDLSKFRDGTTEHQLEDVYLI